MLHCSDVNNAILETMCTRAVRDVFGTLAVIAGMLVVVGCGEETQGPPPSAVSVATPIVRDITEYYSYTGTLAATERVELRARVPGFIEAVTFSPSSDVTKGDPLFLIEPEPYQIAVAAAEASLKRAQAAMQVAQAELEKTQKVYAGRAEAVVELLRAEGTFKQREAEVALAESDLAEAKIRLGYTEVNAPLTGRIDRNQVDAGDLVGSDGPTLLATIVKIRPVWAYFDVSERIVLEYLKRGQSGKVRRADEDESQGSGGLVELALASTPAGEYPFKGRLDFVDNEVDEATGTIRVRAIFPNDDGSLFPGLFARARVPYGRIEGAVMVEENAIGSDLAGRFVWVMGDNNVPAKRYLPALGELRGAYRVVSQGLGPEERYVVAGVQGIRPNQSVKVVPRPEGTAPAAPPDDDPPGQAPAIGTQPGGAGLPASLAPADRAAP